MWNLLPGISLGYIGLRYMECLKLQNREATAWQLCNWVCSLVTFLSRSLVISSAIVGRFQSATIWHECSARALH